jgi:DNA polymerase III epsilon subunit-like protein
MKKLIIDFETSDLFENGGKPIEIGAMLVHEDMTPIAEFEHIMRLEAGEEIDQAAFDKHGMTYEYLNTHGDSRQETLGMFMRWLLENGVDIESSWQVQFLGQNIAFDLKFFWDWWGANPRNWAHYTALDTMIMAEMTNLAVVQAFGPDTEPFIKPNKNGTLVPSASLEAQAKYFGLDYTGAHGAMFDVRLTRECFKRMIAELANGMKS